MPKRERSADSGNNDCGNRQFHWKCRYASYDIFLLPNVSGKSPKDNNKHNGRLNTSPPLIPSPTQNNELTESRSALPIMEMREQILKKIESNKVSLKQGVFFNC